MKTKATHAVSFFVVRVTRDATDMFRYDSCVPANEVESGKYDRACNGTPQYVMFKRFHLVGGAVGPTEGRWQSYGGTCVTDAFRDTDEAQQALRWYLNTHPMEPRCGL
jgi:hypothetical protein